MIYVELLKLEFTKLLRSESFYRNILVSIFLFLLGLFFASILFFAGLFSGSLLEKMGSEYNAVEILNSLMCYFILFGISIRLFLQNLASINIISYQSLPIKRSAITNFIILRPLLSPINYIVLFFIIPFSFSKVMSYYDGFTCLRFIFNFLCIIYFNSLFTAFLKRKIGKNYMFMFLFLGIIIGLISLDYFKILSFTKISIIVFGFILNNAFTSILMLLAVYTAFSLNKVYFARNYYTEDFNKNLDKYKTYNYNFSILKRFGITGEIMILQLKLILKHKRSKNLLYTSIFLLLYGLIIYSSDTYKDYTMYFLAALFSTGAFMYIFGQWAMSLNSSHFDFIVSSGVSSLSYIKSFFLLFLISNALGFILCIPYIFLDTNILYIQISAFLFNSGIINFLLIYFGTYNTTLLNLNQRAAFNYQGVSYKQFIYIFAIILVPIIIFSILKNIFNLQIAILTFSFIGCLGLLLYKQLIKLCVNKFNSRKYALAEGFRRKI